MQAGKFGIDSSNSMSDDVERPTHVVSTDASFLVRHDETIKHKPNTTHDQKQRLILNIGISTLKVAKADFLAVLILGHGPKQSAHLILILELQLLIAGYVCAFANIVSVFLNIIFRRWGKSCNNIVHRAATVSTRKILSDDDKCGTDAPKDVFKLLESGVSTGRYLVFPPIRGNSNVQRVVVADSAWCGHG